MRIDAPRCCSMLADSFRSGLVSSSSCPSNGVESNSIRVLFPLNSLEPIDSGSERHVPFSSGYFSSVLMLWRPLAYCQDDANGSDLVSYLAPTIQVPGIERQRS